MAAITVTNSGNNMIRDAMQGTAMPKITYVSWGTSSTAPAVTDTRLGNEVGRKSVTSYANGASIGELLTSCYLAPADAVGVAITEIGFWGGNATSAANSGTLVARGLYSHTKINTESITLQFDSVV